MVDQSTRTVTSPSIRFASSNSVRLTLWPLSAFSTTIALNFAMALAPADRCSFTSLGHCASAAAKVQPSGCGRHGPYNRLFDNRQVDDCGSDAEGDRPPPDHVVGAGAFK